MSVPERVALAHARHNLVLIMTGPVVVFVVVMMSIQSVFRTVDDVSLGNLNAPEFETESRDEIGSQALSFNRTRRSLVAAYHLLEE